METTILCSVKKSTDSFIFRDGQVKIRQGNKKNNIKSFSGNAYKTSLAVSNASS